MKYWYLSALVLASIGVTYFFAQPKGPRTTIDLAWMDAMTRSTDEGVTRSMAPVTVRVYRALDTPDGAETTFENLEFRVPQAYTLTAGIPQLPLDNGQGWGDMILHVHQPSGRPSIFFEDFIEERLRWVRPGTSYVDPPPYPIDHYFLAVAGRRPYTSGYGLSALQRWRHVEAYTRNTAWPHAVDRGEVCGWLAFDHGDPRYGVQRPVDVHDIYFDTIDPARWRRTIECGPHTYSFCRLSTQYQQFGLTIGFAPRNICKWRDIEAGATSLLDRLLVAHNPPTRRWSNPERRGGDEVEWTNGNLNNPNIERDAR